MRCVGLGCGIEVHEVGGFGLWYRGVWVWVVVWRCMRWVGLGCGIEVHEVGGFGLWYRPV